MSENPYRTLTEGMRGGKRAYHWRGRPRVYAEGDTRREVRRLILQWGMYHGVQKRIAETLGITRASVNVHVQRLRRNCEI